MNKNYNSKKRITIAMLSVLAVCLAGGLAWYMGLMGKPAAEPEGLVTVPETDTGGTVEQEAEPQQSTEATGEEETGTIDAGEGIEDAGEEPGKEPWRKEDGAEPGDPSTERQGIEDTSATSETPPSQPEEDDRTQTEMLPSEPSIEADGSADVEKQARDEDSQPGHSQPQGADTVPEGMVYVPGFGYIESSGPNRQETSRADGDWDKQIGTMQ